MADSIEIQRVIEEAIVAFKEAAKKQWEADGQVDRGSCGGFMLGYRGNTKFAKALLRDGLGLRMDGKVYVTVSHSYPSQHMEIEVQGLRAFRAVAEKHGFVATEARSYVD